MSKNRSSQSSPELLFSSVKTPAAKKKTSASAKSLRTSPTAPPPSPAPSSPPQSVKSANIPSASNGTLAGAVNTKAKGPNSNGGGKSSKDDETNAIETERSSPSGSPAVSDSIVVPDKNVESAATATGNKEICNVALFEHLKKIPASQRSKLVKQKDLEKIGKGINGSAFFGTIDGFPDVPLVFKQQPVSQHADNEYEALMFLREEMLGGRLPSNYVFLYGSYMTTKVLPSRATKPFRNFILEYVDKSLDDFLLDNDLSELEYYRLFYRIAEAVSHLERIKMNHGDLWGENIMLSFEYPEEYDPEDSDSEEIYEVDLPYTIKFIDFDAAFKRGSKVINKPALGGSDERRRDFYLGYDMNRILDAVLYNYRGITKLINKYRKSKEYKTEGERGVQEFYEENIRYPVGFIRWIESLGTVTEPDRAHKQQPKLSGVEIMKSLQAKIDQLTNRADNSQ